MLPCNGLNNKFIVFKWFNQISFCWIKALQQSVNDILIKQTIENNQNASRVAPGAFAWFCNYQCDLEVADGVLKNQTCAFEIGYNTGCKKSDNLSSELR